MRTTFIIAIVMMLSSCVAKNDNSNPNATLLSSERGGADQIGVSERSKYEDFDLKNSKESNEKVMKVVENDRSISSATSTSSHSTTGAPNQKNDPRSAEARHKK